MYKITYREATEAIKNALQREGWERSGPLKIPWVDNGAVRLYFKGQSIHATTSGQRQGTARSITIFWMDPKQIAFDIESKASPILKDLLVRSLIIAGVIK